MTARRHQTNGVLVLTVTVGTRTVRLCIPVGAPLGPSSPDQWAMSYFGLTPASANARMYA